MGAVIDKNAAAADIMADVNQTLVKAQARAQQGQPRWLELADGRLTRPLSLWTSRQDALVPLDRELRTLRATIGVVDDASDLSVMQLREALWNAAGRPGPNDDPHLDLLFPEGGATYADETLEGTADALEFLAELLRTVGHPKVAAATLEAGAVEMQAHAAKHRTAVAALKAPLTRQRLLGKACTAIAKSARLQLVKLKRAYALADFSEADIHQVIPDRSVPRATTAAPTPTPVA